MSLGLINHRIAPFLAYKPDHVDDFTIAHGLISNADRDRFRDQTLKALSRELSLYSDHKWIISSEHFVARLVAKDELESLAALLDQLFDLEQIISYLRKPIEAAISKWSTAVLAGWPSFTLAHPAASVEVCNHKGIIQKWIAVFGQHHFNVRLFHKGDFIGGDLIQDFLSACKIDCRRSLNTSHRTNLALSYQAIKLLSRVNEEIPATVGNRMNPIRQDIGTYFISHFADFPGYQPTKAELSSYESFYRKSSNWVRDQFFQDKKDLWLPTQFREQDDHRFKPDCNRLEKAFIDTVVTLWKDLHK